MRSETVVLLTLSKNADVIQTAHSQLHVFYQTMLMFSNIVALQMDNILQ